ncbi:MAG: hypothetical protein N2V78_09255 [Methanophagales archaeon]|nr:hypothetical protein [Methanophagales archaeon]
MAMTVTVYLIGDVEKVLKKDKLFNANKSRWIEGAIRLRLEEEGKLPKEGD